MAITYTPKLKLPLYSDGNDKHPGRLDNNALMNLIESNVLGSSQGLHASRPGAGTPGRAYFSTDRATLSYDNGTTWVDLVPIGGVVPSGVIVGSTGSEGTSARVARADHSHAIPLATSAVHGLMPSADKSKLDGATTNATANTVALRDASGRISVGSPTVAAHAATKAYVDTAASNASNLSTGTVDPARIANASSAVDGLMSSADKIKLDAATASPTDGTLVARYNGGETNFKGVYLSAAPVSASHATRKDYVDTQIGTRAPANHNHDGGDITSGLINQARIANATSSLNGLMSSADKAKLDAAGYDAGPSAIVMTDHLGNVKSKAFFANVGEGQTNIAHALTRKDYVDGKKWDGADITSGLINPARIANASSSTDGLMSKADKIKLDGAAIADLPNTLALRNAGGDSDFRRVNITDAPTGAQHATRKDYVDGKKWDGADITSGLINPARIANATSSLDGLMSKADKAKLDTASVSGLGNTLMMRASNGATNVTALYISSPTTETTQAARKDYVDGKISDLAPGGWVNLSLASGWTTLSGYGTPQARLNGTTVELRGTIQRTTGVIGNTIFTLPAGHIPGVSRMLSVPINTTKSTRASVTGGTGAFYITSENTDLAFVGLDGVQFEK